MLSTRRETRREVVRGSPNDFNSVQKVADSMVELRDKILPLIQATPGFSKMLGPNFLPLFTEISNSVEQLLKLGNTIDLVHIIDYLQSYTSLGACISLTKSILIYIQNEVNSDKRDHDDRQNRIRNVLREVDAKLEIIDYKAEKLGHLMLKILQQKPENEANLIEFNFRFDLIVVELDSCTSRLLTAKKDLEEGFTSIKAYVRQIISRSTGFGAGAVAVPSTVIPTALRLVPFIGRLGVIGVAGAAATVGTLALCRIAHTFWKEFKYAKNVKGQYRDLERELGELESQMEGLRGKMEAHRNAKLVLEQQEEIRRLTNMLQNSESP